MTLGGDARAPRRAVADPTSGDALVLERGARRATGNEAYVNRWPTRTPDAGGDARAPRGAVADPTSGDALVLERGARRATGSEAYVKRWSARTPDAGGDARAPRGAVADPTSGDAPGLGRGAHRATGGPRPSPASVQRTPDAGGDARAPRGRPALSRRKRPIRRSAFPGEPPHIPRLESRPASGAEPTGRRGAHVHHQPPYNAPQMRAGTPALPGDPSARGKDADQEIGVPRRALEGLRREDAGATLALPTWFAARAGNGGFSWRDWVPAGLATKTTGSMRSHPWCPCRSMLSMMGGAIC
jgi:hypothetical protein